MESEQLYEVLALDNLDFLKIGFSLWAPDLRSVEKCGMKYRFVPQYFISHIHLITVQEMNKLISSFAKLLDAIVDEFVPSDPQIVPLPPEDNIMKKPSR